MIDVPHVLAMLLAERTARLAKFYSSFAETGVSSQPMGWALALRGTKAGWSWSQANAFMFSNREETELISPAMFPFLPVRE